MSQNRTSARHRSAARERMARTGEKYTVALAYVLSESDGSRREVAVLPFSDASVSISFDEADHLSIVGTSLSGKTLLAEEIVRQLRGRGVVYHATDIDLSNAELVEENERNLAEVALLLTESRNTEPVFLVLDRADYLSDRALGVLESVLADAGEHGIHVIAVQSRPSEHWNRRIAPFFNHRVIMGKASRRFIERELRSKLVIEEGHRDWAALYEDSDQRVVYVPSEVRDRAQSS